MALMVDVLILDDDSEAMSAQFTFLSLSQSIFDRFPKFFFPLKAYDFIGAFLVGAHNFLTLKSTKQGPCVE